MEGRDARRTEEDLARARVELAARVAGVTRLATLGSPLRRMTDIQSALDEVLRTIATLLDAKSVVLMLYDPQRDELFPQASLDVPDAYLDTLARVERPIGVRGTGLATVEPLVMEDVRLSPLSARYADAAERAGIRAIYSTPLVTLGNELMGTIAAFFPQPHRPPLQRVELVEAYARQAAEMVERARMHGEARQLAALERRRATQLRALADAALTISAAATLADLLHVVTEAARDVIGVHRAMTSRLDGGAGTTTYASPPVPWEPGALDPVVRENRPLRLGPDQLAAPLVSRKGGNLGAILLADTVDGTEFTGEDEAMLVQLAQMASVAIENLELVERERAAREEAERNARLRGLLADASQAFAASLEIDATLATISALIVPDLADWISVHLLGETGRIEPAYVRHRDRLREREVREVLERDPPRRDAPDGAGRVIRTGEPELGGARLVVPLAARGRTFGALSLVREDGSPYTDSDALLARELADRAALAVDNAARFAFERETAATLQRSLLPQELPLTPVVDAASRYLPGASGTSIGGDWYDVIALDDGRVAMVVGDVMGRGVTAAAVMGQLRAAVRAYAVEGHPPAVLLERLDRVMQALGEAQLTTCLYAVYDPGRRTVTLSTAGHLPALLVAPDGSSRYVDLDPGLPLGVGGATFAETTVEVEPGTLLVLYTDGLVEGPHTPIDSGLAALRDAIPASWRTLDEMCDRVLHALGRDGGHDDDTALLAVAFTGAGPGGAHTSPVLELAPAPESVRLARRFVGERIARVAAPGVAETAELLVSELVTNAIRYARSSVAVRLVTLPHTVRVDVTDESPAPPVRGELVDEEAEGGRGMVLVGTLAHRWGYERLLAGKRVWFELLRA